MFQANTFFMAQRVRVFAAVAISSGMLMSTLALAQSSPSARTPAAAQSRPSTRPAPATAPHPATSTAPQKDLPPAKELLAAAIDAMGGKAALDAIESVAIKGSTKAPMVGEIPLEIYSSKPDKFFIKVAFPNAGEIRYGSDGKVGWTDSPMMGGIQLLDADQTKQPAEEANIFRVLVSVQEKARELETVDRSDFADHPCYKVRIVNEGGQEQFAYFDVDSKMLRGTRITQDSPRGPIETISSFGEWKQIGDVKLFSRIDSEQMGMKATTNFTEIELNKVDPAIFQLPPEVLELVAKKQAASQPAATKPATQPETRPSTRPSTAPGAPRPPERPK